MIVSLSYALWRLIRISMVVVVLTLVFACLWFIIQVFANPLYAPFVLLGSFPLFLVAAFVLIRSPEVATAAWHKKELLATRELYSSLYDLSPVPYLTLDAKGRVTMCNMAAARLFDTTLDDLMGKEIFTRLDSPDETKLSVVLGKLSARASIYDAELTITSFTDVRKWVLFSLFINQTFDQQLVALVDISHQKQVDKAKSEFVSLATHQLRTPVAALRWNIELLERTVRGTASEKQQTYLLKINRNVSRMLSLINDFLSVSKLETGTFATTLIPLRVSEQLLTIVDEYQQAILEKQITFNQSFEPSKLMLTTDERLFHIIMSNLISNAVKYVRPSDSITLGYRVVREEVEFTIADTGIGIPSEQLPQLFSKFFRASNAMLHRAEGTGLGLYIVKESVVMLGGTIEVATKEGAGTTFTVKLPLR